MFGFTDDYSTIPILILFNRLLCTLYRHKAENIEEIEILEVVGNITKADWD